MILSHIFIFICTINFIIKLYVILLINIQISDVPENLLEGTNQPSHWDRSRRAQRS
jgi:hypothetical protein